jgi:hypothetical protein
MHKLFFLIFLLSMLHSAYATHLIGGEIQVSRVSSQSLTYQIKVQIYMDETSGALASEGQSQITLCIGEGRKTITIKRVSKIRITPSVSLNSYIEFFTYAAPGTYTVSVAIENRSGNLVNFNSINTPFYIQTTFATNIVNTTPTLNSAIGIQPAYSKQVFKENVNGFDTEGDSLVYRLGVSKQGQSNTCTVNHIPDYRYPNEVTQEGLFQINAHTGELTWNAPVKVGSYAYVIIVEEWRDGVRISETQREVTLQVIDQGGDPVIIPPFEYPSNRLITGIEDESKAFSRIFPSPTQNSITIFYSALRPTKVLFQLIDTKGKIVEEYQENERFLTHNHDFSVRDLPSGIYFIRTISDKTITNKFIKE